MTRRLMMLAGLLALLLAGPAWAGEKYDSFGAHSPKVIQPDDTIASEWDQSAGGKKVTKTTLDACERLQDQASKGHCVMVDAANLAVISKTTAVTIGGGVANDTYLKRIKVLTTLNTACVVTGFADTDGAAQSFTIPVAVADHYFGGAKNSAGALTITCSNSLDDNQVIVEWWPAS